MTDSSQKPPAPNYVPDVGRLVTDRFDFQTHVNGTAFRHVADQIDMSPLITINGTQPTNVQAAIVALTAAISPFTTPPSTPTTLGTIQLAGDLGGVGTLATSPKVSGLQGRPIQNIAPASGQVLTWNIAGYWGPAPTTSFAAGGDLSGTSASQTVIGIQGHPIANTVPTAGQALIWSGSNWAPSSAGTFIAGGDLTGNDATQYIQSLSGANNGGGAVNLAASTYLNLASTAYINVGAGINQSIIKSGNSTNFVSSDSSNNFHINSTGTIYLSSNSSSIAQLGNTTTDFIVLGDTSSNAAGIGLIRTSTNNPGGTGKTIIGVNQFSGIGSYALLSTDNSSNTVIQSPTSTSIISSIKGVSSATQVFAVNINGIALGTTPSYGGGTGVAFLQNATVTPSVSPTAGALLYATGGDLWVYQSNGTNFPIQPISSNSNSRAYYGSGTDGYAVFDGTSTVILNGTSFIPSANIYTLVRSIACTNMVVNSGVTIITAGFAIYCTGTLTNNGNIDNSGTTAGTGSGAIAKIYGGGSDGGIGDTGSGPGNGVSYSGTSVGFGGAGGQGGGSGGTGGTLNNSGIPLYTLSAADLLSGGLSFPISPSSSSAFTLWGGAGGGGGTGVSFGSSGFFFANGGAGGGGGGYMLICANTVAGTGTYTSEGGAGEPGTNNSGHIGCGGGGGGGGSIVIIYSITSTIIATNVSGGAGGAGSVPGAHGGIGIVVVIVG